VLLSFNQNCLTSTTSHYIPSDRTTLHQQLRITFLQSELLYTNNFGLHSSNQKHLIQTTSHWVTWFRTTLQQQFHFLLQAKHSEMLYEITSRYETTVLVVRNRVPPWSHSQFTVSSQFVRHCRWVVSRSYWHRLHCTWNSLTSHIYTSRDVSQ